MIGLLGEMFSSGGAAVVGAVVLLLGLVGSAVCAAALAVVDLREHRLPNRIVYPWTLASVLLLLVVAASGDEIGSWVRALLAGVVWSSCFLVVKLIHPPSIGMGDVKLVLGLGLWTGFLGWGAVLAAVMLSFLLGGVVSVMLVLTRRAGRRTRIPFGPFLLVGSGLVLVLW
ncbi:A24 family peptidase [Nesterenkonia aerolata]|uniref:A24 family peptidase n=1 Tax=Nesterenkonia aerolata TaxID=3074079 RepID=A0ABU2DRA0_9MICC|nr:A24 family peptidase [Nesterenkonia sp. LY-0111]MDR8018850.1 A24 family peptidase [Nesterenkonia sp. LY-0111]